MTDARQKLGKSGEDLACAELVRRGYEILARRYRRRGGEIDIVARDGRTIVFVEVKTRSSRDFGGGGEAVHPRKQRTMAAIALDFLARGRFAEVACRFDVVVIDCQSAPPAVELYQNAFDVD